MKCSREGDENEKSDLQDLTDANLTVRLIRIAFAPHRSFQALQDAITKVLEEFDSMSADSGVYSTLASMNAKNHRDGHGYLRQAANSFFSSTNTDSRVVYMDYTRGDLVLNDGMVMYHQRQYGKAMDSLTQIVDPETLRPKITLPERSEVEVLNVMALASLKSKDKDMEKTLHIWDTAIAKAKHLKSEQRFSEAFIAYEIMEAVWPHEKPIAERRELAMHW